MWYDYLWLQRAPCEIDIWSSLNVDVGVNLNGVWMGTEAGEGETNTAELQVKEKDMIENNVVFLQKHLWFLELRWATKFVAPGKTISISRARASCSRVRIVKTRRSLRDAAGRMQNNSAV